MTISPTRRLKVPDLDQFFRDIHLCRGKTSVTHGLHPYPAKFIPHIPRNLLAAFGRVDLPVLDPMCGSGTALVEAALSGYRAIGVDLNPIAVLAATAKTTRIDRGREEALARLSGQLRTDALNAEESCSRAEPRDFHNRTKWFEPHVIQELARALELADVLEPGARTIAQSAVSAVLVAVSNQESETRWCAKPKSIAGGETLTRIADKLDAAVVRAREFTHLAADEVQVLRSDARALPLADGSVGTIVTSPPYANSHDYYLYNKLRMFVLGYDVARVQAAEIGSRNRHSDLKAPIEHYLEAMRCALGDWKRVLAPGGRAAVVVGDAVVRGTVYDMGEQFTVLADDVGLELEQRYVFSHRQFNSTFQRGFGTKFEKYTHVLVFRK
jgi:site-specific DNA-methyltransferase (cytosine-N4-specific)